MKQRLFSRITPGSFRSVVFIMISGISGTGIIAMPTICEYIGLINGIIMIVSCYLIAIGTMTMMTRSAERLCIFEFGRLVRFLYSRKVSRIFEVSFICYEISCIVSYQISICQIVTEILRQLFGLESTTFHQILQILFTTTLCFYHSLQKKYSEFSFSFIFSFFVLIYIIVVSIVETPIFIHEKNWKLENIVYFKWDLDGFFNAFGVVIFSFENHTAFLETLKELHRPYRKQLGKVRDIGEQFELALYGVVLFCGYISKPGNATEMLVTRRNSNGGIDIPMIVGAILFIFYLEITIIITYIPIKRQILEFFDYPDPLNPTSKFNFWITMFLLYVPAFFSILMPSFYTFTGIIGGFGGILFMVTFPSMIYLRTYGKRGRLRNSVIFFAVFLTILGFSSSGYTIVTLIRN